MQTGDKRVLLLYSDPYYLVQQVPPVGLDCLAQHLRLYGWDVQVASPWLPETELRENLKKLTEDFRPQFVGYGLRNFDTCFACEAFGNYQGPGFQARYFLPEVRMVVDLGREICPDAVHIMGGGAFSVSPEGLLAYFGLDYGIVGPGEEPLRQFVEAWPDSSAVREIPGLIWRDGSDYQSNPPWKLDFETASPTAWDPGFLHGYEAAGLPMRVKRGCNQGCAYCVEPIIEGRRIIYRPLDSIISQLLWAAEKLDQVRKVFFVDTEFNVPDERHATKIIQGLLEKGLHRSFNFSSQFLPRPFSPEFAELLAQAGFSVVLTADSFSDQVLEQVGVSYRRKDIEQALGLCENLGLPVTVNLIFGLPGETWETLEETSRALSEFPENPYRRYEYTVGGRMYHGTQLTRRAANEPERVYGRISRGMLEPCFYCSPAPPLELKAWLDEHLDLPLVYANNPTDVQHQALGLRYLVDHGLIAEAVDRFLDAHVKAQAQVYDGLLQALTREEENEAAKRMTLGLLENLQRNPEISPALMGIAQYYLSLLGG